MFRRIALRIGVVVAALAMFAFTAQPAMASTTKQADDGFDWTVFLHVEGTGLNVQYITLKVECFSPDSCPNKTVYPEYTLSKGNYSEGPFAAQHISNTTDGYIKITLNKNLANDTKLCGGWTGINATPCATIHT